MIYLTWICNRTSGSEDELLDVNIPLNVCWTCKNGQVWISISHDKDPQVIFQNETEFQLVYTEVSECGDEAYREAYHFPQYHVLPPYSRGFYTFPSSQINFPEIMKNYKVPTFMIGRYVKDIEAIYKNVRRFNMLCRGNGIICKSEYK